MVEGVVALDADQRILFANDRRCELLELPPGDTWAGGSGKWCASGRCSTSIDRALTQADPVREEIDWTGARGRSLTVHAARLPAGRRAAPCLCSTTPPSCAAWNGCARSSSPTFRTS